jgi:hypothetical protein
MPECASTQVRSKLHLTSEVGFEPQLSIRALVEPLGKCPGEYQGLIVVTTIL